MEKTKVTFGQEARKKLIEGIDIVANAVKSTIGPKGRTVVIEKGSFVDVTKDGYSVARAIKLEDPEMELGARLVREASSKTNDKVGDGTSSAALIAQTLIKEGMKKLSAGYSPTSILSDMNKTLKETKEILLSMSQKVDTPEKVEQIASVSANSKEIGKIIGDMIKQIGHEGVILVEESHQNTKIETEVTKGMRFNRGYKSPFMVTNPDKLESEFTDVPILITDKKIVSQFDMVPVMKKVAEGGKNEMVVICDDMEGEALANVMINGAKGVFRALVVRAPEFGERQKQTLQDIALLTGGKFISNDMGMQLKDVLVSDLGTAHKVVASRDYTIIAGGNGDDAKIQDRVKEIKKELEQTESEYEKIKIRLRLGNLSGGVGVVKAGASTETEVKEVRDRIEDSVHATQAALESGILCGGGVALLKAYHEVKTDSILKSALKSQIYQVSLNAGKEPAEVILNVENGLKKKQFYGYNADTDNYEEDMVEAGVIDPTAVVVTALETACSIATMAINSEILVTATPQKKENV